MRLAKPLLVVGLLSLAIGAGLLMARRSDADWAFHTPTPLPETVNCGSIGLAVASGDTLAMLDPKTGRPLWQRKLVSPAVALQWSPERREVAVALANNKGVAVLNARGEAVAGFPKATAPFDLSPRALFTGFQPFAAYDLRSRKELWRLKADTQEAELLAVRYAEGVVYAAFNRETPTLVAMDSATGRVYWTQRFRRGPGLGKPTIKPVKGGPVLFSQYGELVAINAASGRVLWQFQVDPGELTFSVAVGPTSDTAYVGTNGQRLLALNMANGAPRWAQLLTWSVDDLVVGSERIVASADRQLRLLRKKDGRQEAGNILPASLRDFPYGTVLRPLIGPGGTIIVSSSDGAVYGLTR